VCTICKHPALRIIVSSYPLRRFLDLVAFVRSARNTVMYKRDHGYNANYPKPFTPSHLPQVYLCGLE